MNRHHIHPRASSHLARSLAPLAPCGGRAGGEGALAWSVTSSHNPPPSPARGEGSKRARGFSLIIVLIFLVVLSLLAVFAVRGVVTSERMAGNTQDWNLAFQAAEAALHDGEADVSGLMAPEAGGAAITTRPISGAAGFAATCPTGLCLPATAINSAPVWSVDPSSPLTDDNGWKFGATAGAGPSVQYGAYTQATAFPDPIKADNSVPLAAQPRYIIESLGTPVASTGGGGLAAGTGYAGATSGAGAGSAAVNAYRVTAVGFGKIVTLSGNPATRVMLQSTITR